MKRRSNSEKLEKKRHALLARTALALQISEAEARELFSLERRQSVRLNPLVASPAATLKAMQALGWQGTAFTWAEHGHSIEAGAEALRDSELVQNGAAFIQNAASWLPVFALSPHPNETILDVCAAPGGKTTHIAALAGNQARIVANDNSRQRLAKLQATCRRLHANIERFTLFDATRLSHKLAGEQFNKILLDAPCSGEGLINFNKDKDLTTWSVAHIRRLQKLQKQLIFQAWQLLKPGGILIYSTCTIAPEENELVMQYALKTLPGCELLPMDYALANRTRPALNWNDRPLNSQLAGCLRLQPSRDIEAFFVAKLQKSTSAEDS